MEECSLFRGPRPIDKALLRQRRTDKEPLKAVAAHFNEHLTLRLVGDDRCPSNGESVDLQPLEERNRMVETDREDGERSEGGSRRSFLDWLLGLYFYRDRHGLEADVVIVASPMFFYAVPMQTFSEYTSEQIAAWLHKRGLFSALETQVRLPLRPK